MKDDNKNISLADPELPEFLRDARRNHGGMTVPEGFFAQFEQQMNQIIDQEQEKGAAAEVQQPAAEQATRETKSAVLRPRRWISVAAAVCLIVGLSLFLQHGGNDATVPTDVIEQTEDGAEGITRGLAEFEGNAEGNDASLASFTEEEAADLLVSASDYDMYELYCEI